MLKAVARVRKEVVLRCSGRQIDLETIAEVIKDQTILTEIEFVKFDSPETNPILGSFSRWTESPAVYAASNTIVKVNYASHLPADWKRFVVCKELCHVLDEVSGNHVASDTEIDRLVEGFSISSSAATTNPSAGLQSEYLAIAGAIELLFPLEDRENFLRNHSNPKPADIAAAAASFNIPTLYAEVGLSKEFNEIFRVIIET